jgi:hypothetical protein
LLSTTADSREMMRVDQPGPFHILFDMASSLIDVMLYFWRRRAIESTS